MSPLKRRVSLPRVAMAAVAAATVLAGCGSTVQPTAQTSGASQGLSLSQGDTTPGVGGTGGTGSTLSGAGGGGSGGLAVGGSGSARGGVGSTGVAGGSGSGSATGTAGVTGNQATATGAATHAPLKVGIVVLTGGSQALSAIGQGSNVAFGNGKLEADAVVQQINQQGGVGGRKITPIFGDWNAASGNDGLTKICTQFTEDDHVDVILDVINVNQEFVACAAVHHTILINASFGPGDDVLYQHYGDYFYSPSLIDLNRELHLVLDAAKTSGRLGKGTRVGVLYDGSDPEYERVANSTVVPLLKSWGVPYEIYGASSSADLNGAALRFETDHVTQVAFIAPSGIGEIAFMQTAQQQGYHPGYLVGDSADPWYIGMDAPQQQATKLFGAGTLPISDVATKSFPTTPAEKQCLDLIRKHGESNSDRHTSLTATLYCELGYELRAIGNHIKGSYTAPAFAAAYNAVGTHYHPVTTLGTDFTTQRFGGADTWRELGYSNSCRCVAYLSAPQRMAF